MRNGLHDLEQRKVWRIQAAKESYLKLPEVFHQRATWPRLSLAAFCEARVNEEQRQQEAKDAELAQKQELKLLKEKLKDAMKVEEEELHLELHAAQGELKRPKVAGEKVTWNLNC